MLDFFFLNLLTTCGGFFTISDNTAQSSLSLVTLCNLRSSTYSLFILDYLSRNALNYDIVNIHYSYRNH